MTSRTDLEKTIATLTTEKSDLSNEVFEYSRMMEELGIEYEKRTLQTIPKNDGKNYDADGFRSAMIQGVQAIQRECVQDICRQGSMELQQAYFEEFDKVKDVLKRPDLHLNYTSADAVFQGLFEQERSVNNSLDNVRDELPGKVHQPIVDKYVKARIESYGWVTNSFSDNLRKSVERSDDEFFFRLGAYNILKSDCGFSEDKSLSTVRDALEAGIDDATVAYFDKKTQNLDLMVNLLPSLPEGDARYNMAVSLMKRMKPVIETIESYTGRDFAYGRRFMQQITPFQQQMSVSVDNIEMKS